MRRVEMEDGALSGVDVVAGAIPLMRSYPLLLLLSRCERRCEDQTEKRIMTCCSPALNADETTRRKSTQWPLHWRVLDATDV